MNAHRGHVYFRAYRGGYLARPDPPLYAQN